LLRQKLLNQFNHFEPITELASSGARQSSVTISCGNLTASSLIVSTMIAKGGHKVLCVLPDEAQAQSFHDNLEEILEQEILFYPALGSDLWRELGPTTAQVGRRISCLSALLRNDFSCFVTTPAALLEKVAAPEDIELYKIDLHVGEIIIFDQFIRQLVEMGYVRENRVDSPGELCVRGGIVDVFMFEEESPIRIEFFGDEIESIRRFDVETQRSLEKIEQAELYPLGCAGPYTPIEERTEYDLLLQKTLFDFIPENTLLWLQNRDLVLTNLEAFEREAMVRFETLEQEGRLVNAVYADFYTGFKTVEKELNRRPILNAGPLLAQEGDAITMNVFDNAHFGGDLKLFRAEVEDIVARDKDATVVIACDSTAQRDRLQEVLFQEGFPQSIDISALRLSGGFSWPERNLYLYTNSEIYSRVRLARIDRIARRTVSFREQLAINKGDWVVHEEYGIGIYRAVEKITAYGKVVECLRLEYDGGDVLFVPLEKMDKIQKYSSSDGAKPVLSKLGSPNWEKLKTRTKKRMKEIAAELIKLYATRKARPGYAFSEDTVWQKELEASFPFEETVDQMGAIEDVKKDMQLDRPMDRLICGDVGYGKTEVAVRAAFKAINEGKQVAVLVPTTILAQQHFDTFSGRLERFPVKIELLSRFKTPAQQKSILHKVSAGEIDLVVGTHRLLSKDVKFKELGLLVVDEEQRFGVMHKEKLKLLKQSVDTLTLSATPIPRTMHMALMGAKDMSIINSPPQNRLPVKTIVSRFDKELIRDAVLHELDRNGQVFFVHNRVQSIFAIAAMLNELVPEAKTVVAHGQMRGHQLERAMLKFVSGQAQILVSTMIIENGIDLPKANTLIINRADKLGLAQLYQLRGRVGRSDRQAFAYLLIPPVRKLTRDAIKRLQTIQEYSELGAGYKIAMRDLEIRGAGNVFGAEQTGFVNALGFELYSKIIKQSIEEIKEGLDLDVEKSEQEAVFDVNIQCKTEAYLPEDYVALAAERVDIYRRLVRAANEHDVDELQTELIDRFGKLPKPARNLLDYIHIKNLASAAKIKKLRIDQGILSGSFDLKSVPGGDAFRPWLGQIVAHAPETFELKHTDNELSFEMKLERIDSELHAVKKFLQKIV